jgi:hypothetical protein
MEMLHLAHAGHTLTTIAYFLPVVAFIAWLVVTQLRERRRHRGRPADAILDPPRGRSSAG